MQFPPARLQGGVEAFPKCDRHLASLPVLVERDSLADVVHDHLAGIAAGHVLLEFRADGRVHRAVHVFVQQLQKFFALHVCQKV